LTYSTDEPIIDPSVERRRIKMATFLVIGFDRYDTNRTTHKVVEADTHQQAVLIYHGIENSPEELEEYQECNTFEQVDEIFACEPYEESDLLIYKIG